MCPIRNRPLWRRESTMLLVSLCLAVQPCSGIILWFLVIYLTGANARPLPLKPSALQKTVLNAPEKNIPHSSFLLFETCYCFIYSCTHKFPPAANLQSFCSQVKYVRFPNQERLTNVRRRRTKKFKPVYTNELSMKERLKS